jgi:hypothetical protein
MAENNDEQIDVAEETNLRLRHINNTLNRLISQVMESNKILEKGEEREEQNDKEDKRKKKNKKEDETEEKRVGKLYKMIFGKTPAEIREEKNAESKAKAGQRVGGLLGVGGLVESVLGSLIKYGALAGVAGTILGQENVGKLLDKLYPVVLELVDKVYTNLLEPILVRMKDGLLKLMKETTDSLGKSLLGVDSLSEKVSSFNDTLTSMDTDKDGLLEGGEIMEWLAGRAKKAVEENLYRKPKNKNDIINLFTKTREERLKELEEEKNFQKYFGDKGENVHQGPALRGPYKGKNHRLEEYNLQKYFGTDGEKVTQGGTSRASHIKHDLTSEYTTLPENRTYEVQPVSPFFDERVAKAQMEYEIRQEFLKKQLANNEKNTGKQISADSLPPPPQQKTPPDATPQYSRTWGDVFDSIKPSEETMKTMGILTVATLAFAALKNPSLASKLLGAGLLGATMGEASASEKRNAVTSMFGPTVHVQSQEEEIGSYIGGLVKPPISDKTIKMKKSSDLNTSKGSSPIIINKNDNSRTSINSVNSSGGGRGNDLPRTRNSRPAFGN